MRCSQEGLALRRGWRAHRYPPASLSHRFAWSPVDALIDLKVGCRLRRQIPIGLNVHPVICLRVAVIPQRWPARRGWRRFGRGWDRMAQRRHPRRALAHVGWLGFPRRRLCQRCHRSPVRRIRGQHTKVAVPVRARRWHQVFLRHHQVLTSPCAVAIHSCSFGCLDLPVFGVAP